MNSPTAFFKSDDGGYDYEESILHDVISHGIKAGLVTRWTPTSVAVRFLDRAGAIQRQDRELLIEVYPDLFQPAKPERKAASEIVFPQP